MSIAGVDVATTGLRRVHKYGQTQTGTHTNDWYGYIRYGWYTRNGLPVLVACANALEPWKLTVTVSGAGSPEMLNLKFPSSHRARPSRLVSFHRIQGGR